MHARWRTLIEFLAVAGGYFAAARIALFFALEGTNASPIWPASGIAFAILLSRGRRLWPAIFVGAFSANIVFLGAGLGVPWEKAAGASAMVGLGNALEAVLGVELLRLFNADAHLLQKSRSTGLFVGVALLMCVSAALIGPLTLCSFGLAPWSVFFATTLTWWLGDVAGVLFITPIFIAWHRTRPTAAVGRHLEAAGMFVALLILLGLIFTGSLHHASSGVLGYLMVPVLMWAAFRFEPNVWVIALAVAQSFAIGCTAAGYGPFVVSDSNTSMLLLQTFLCEISMVTLVLGATVVERRVGENHTRSVVRRLEASNAELSQFAYVVSHDLKAPLRNIHQLTGFLKEDYQDVLDEEGQENLSRVSDCTQRMSTLIDGILEYARTGQDEQPTAWIDTKQIAQNVVANLAPPEKLEIRIEPEMPEVPYVSAHMTQILQNLVQNAIQHHGKETGEVVIGCASEPEHWRFLVRDDGVGISKRHFERIFQLFCTLAGRDNTDSTGIGLSLVKRLVERHGGRIWLESEPDEGTTFFFTVPKQISEPIGIGES